MEIFKYQGLTHIIKYYDETNHSYINIIYMNNNFDIEKFLDLSEYATDERKDRRKGEDATNEFFTPYSIVKKMSDKVSEETWSDPDKNFLESSFGNGQFVVYIIYNKIMHGSTWYEALQHTWGVELLEDNVRETHQRIHNLFEQMDIEYDKEMAQQIMDHNLVCSDFFKWDFQNWCPIKEEKALPLF